VADDLYFADFGKIAEVFAFLFAEKFACVDVWDIEWRQFVCGFTGRGLLEDKVLVLADVTRRFAGEVLHQLEASCRPEKPWAAGVERRAGKSRSLAALGMTNLNSGECRRLSEYEAETLHARSLRAFEKARAFGTTPFLEEALCWCHEQARADSLLRSE
jgi:hypothetical protein